MEHTGLVVEIQGERAIVRFARSRACGCCGACTMTDEGNAQVALQNTLGAQVGDKVRVEFHAKNFLKATFIAYGLPLALLLAGVLLGAQAGDAWAAIAGLMGAGCGYIVLRRLEPRFAKKDSYQPFMVELNVSKDRRSIYG